MHNPRHLGSTLFLAFQSTVAILKVYFCTRISVDQWEMLANSSMSDTWRPQWVSVEIERVEMTDTSDTARYVKVHPALMVLASNTPKAWLSGLSPVAPAQLPVKAMLARCKWLEVWFQGSWVLGQQQHLEGMLKKLVDGQGRVARVELEDEGGVIRVVS